MFILLVLLKKHFFFAKFDRKATSQKYKNIYVGRPAQVDNFKDLGQVMFPKNQKLIRIFFISDDDYLAVQFEKTSLIFQVIEEKRRVQLILQQKFEENNPICLMPFAGQNYDIILFKLVEYANFYKIKQNKVNKIQIDFLHIFQINDDSILYIDKKLRLHYFNLESKFTKIIDSFYNLLIKNILKIRVEKKYYYRNNPHYNEFEVDSNLEEKFLHHDIIGIMDYLKVLHNEKNGKFTSPFEIISFIDKNQFNFSFKNFSKSILQDNIFSIEFPSSLLSEENIQNFNFEIKRLLPKFKIFPLFKFNGKFFNVSPFKTRMLYFYKFFYHFVFL